jgi:hypothetical protein
MSSFEPRRPLLPHLGGIALGRVAEELKEQADRAERKHKGNLLRRVPLVVGVNRIEHGLGRKHEGWTRHASYDADPRIWEIPGSDESHLLVESTGIGAIDLEVY